MYDTNQLSPKQIRAIEDADELEDLIDLLNSEIDSIEVQLEFPDDDRDTEWEHRAKGALRMKRSARRAAEKRLSDLKRADYHEAKRAVQARRLADAEKELVSLERRKAQEIREQTAAIKKVAENQERRIAAINNITKALTKFDYKSAFMKAAREQLDEQTYAALVKLANGRVTQSYIVQLKSSGLEALLEPFEEPDLNIADSLEQAA